MKISIDKNILTIGKKVIEFPWKISHTELFEEVILVITDYYESNINENVWGVNGQGEIIWQVSKIIEVEYNGKK